ncbi:unnamed protein product [Brassicogethes aeneus]|uniref:Kinesin motor domain-containing protein n=1 Tax=Brassicogethes aeneus TaxID=1431903 RepID=A0A9P0BFQ6_BRAAE|nr:unnamed protein product [Brassicogethes aeneus]
MSADTINVAIRVRPLIGRETAKQTPIYWSVERESIYQIDENGSSINEPFSFDHIYTEHKTNQDIYNGSVLHLVKSTLEGFNSTIFAYGQTSSGKTYTMLGSDCSAGIMQLAITDIFDIISKNTDRKYLISVCYMEIYNEKVNDLLDITAKDLRMREDRHGNHFVAVKESVVMCPTEVFDLMRQGNKNRKIGCTDMNEKSSRSHTILKITIESTLKNSESNACTTASINFVDLAGSERMAQTKAEGARLKEGLHINKSLSTLGLVIKQLSEQEKFINFRDSKLTKLLQNSLGGNAKTLIIATVTVVSTDETQSTLSFAQRAKAVKNKPIINKVVTDQDKIKQYARLSADYKTQLEQELAKNEELQKETNDRNKLIQELEQKLNAIESFRGKKISKIPHRRHTISFHDAPKLAPISHHINKIITPQLPVRSLKRQDEDVFKKPITTRPPSLTTIGEDCEFPMFTDEEACVTPKKEQPNLSEKIRELESDLCLKDQKIFELSEQISELQNKTPRSTPSHTPYKILKTRVATLEEEYSELRLFTKLEEECRSEAEEKSFEDLMELYGGLNKEHESLKYKLEDLEATNEINEAKIAELQKTVTALTTKNHTLTKENANLKSHQVQIGTDYQVLQEIQNEKFKEREKMLVNVINELEKKSEIHESYTKLAKIKENLAERLESHAKEIEKLKTIIQDKEREIKEKDQIILEYDEKALEENEEQGEDIDFEDFSFRLHMLKDILLGANVSSLDISFHKIQIEEDQNNELEMRLFKFHDEIYSLKDNLDKTTKELEKERKNRQDVINALENKLKKIEETSNLNLNLENESKEIKTYKFQMERLISEISAMEQDKENRDFNESTTKLKSKISFEIAIKNKEINEIQLKINEAKKNSLIRINEKIKSLLLQSVNILDSLKVSSDRSPDDFTTLKKNSADQEEIIVNNLNEDIQKLKQEIKDLQKSLEEKNVEIHDKNSINTELIEKLAKEKEKTNHHIEEIENLNREIINLQKSIEDNNLELQINTEIQERFGKLQEDNILQIKDIERLKEDINDLQKSLEEKNVEIHDKNSINTELIENLAKEKDKTNNHIEEIENLNREIINLQKSIEEKNLELQINTETQERFGKLQEDNILQIKDIERLKEDVNDLQKAIEEKNIEIQFKEANISGLNKNLQLSQDELKTTLDILNKTKIRNEELEENQRYILKKTEEIHQRQIEELNNNLTEKDQKLQECLEEMAVNQNRMKDLLLKDQENEQQIRELLNKIEAVNKEIEDNKTVSKENYKQLQETIDNLNSCLSEKSEEIKRIIQNTKEKEEQIKDLEEKNFEMLKKVELFSSEKRLSESSQCEQTLQYLKTIRELSTDLEEKSRQIEGYNAAISGLNENVSKQEEKINEILGELTEEKIEVEDLLQKNQEQDKDKQELVERIEKLNENISEILGELSEKKIEVEDLLQKNQENDKAKQELAERIEKLNAEMTNNEIKLQGYENEKRELLEQITNLGAKVSSTEGVVIDEEKDVQSLEDKKMVIQELNTKIEELYSIIADLKSKNQEQLSLEKQYQEYSSTLELKVSQSQSIIDEQIEEIEKLKKELTIHTEHESRIIKYKTALCSHMKKVETLEKQLEEKESELETIEEERAKKVNELLNKLSEVKKANVDMGKKYSVYIEDLNKEEKKVASLEIELQTRENHWKTKVAELRENVTYNEQLYKAYKEKYVQSSKTEESLRNEIKKLLDKCTEKDDRIADLMDTGRSHTPQELRKIKRQSWQDKNRGDVSTGCDSCRDLEEKILDLTERLEGSNRKLKETVEKLEFLENRKSLNTSTSKELTKVRRQSIHDKHRSLNSSFECDKCEKEIPRLKTLLEEKDKNLTDLLNENHKNKSEIDNLQAILKNSTKDSQALKNCLNCVELNSKISQLQQELKAECDRSDEINNVYEECKAVFRRYKKKYPIKSEGPCDDCEALKTKVKGMESVLDLNTKQIESLEHKLSQKNECQDCIKLNSQICSLSRTAKEELEEMKTKFEQKDKKYQESKKYILHFKKIAESKTCDCKSKYEPLLTEKTEKIDEMDKQLNNLSEQKETLDQKCKNLTKISRMRRQEIIVLKGKLGMEVTEEAV